jgi:protein-S-isoprenylcysteine O-methyltransferase Ste14
MTPAAAHLCDRDPGGVMMSEFTFRLIALAVGVAHMTVRTVWERKLRRPSKAAQLSAAGARDKRDLAIVAIGMTPMWVYILTPMLDFARMGLPPAVRLAGVFAGVAGMVVLAASHSALGASWSPVVEAPAAGLVTGGVYRWVRHPMYGSFLLFNVGSLLISSNWLAGIPAVAGMMWLYVSRVNAEERLMLGIFGAAYRHYAERTGRIIPGIGSAVLAGKRLRTYGPLNRPHTRADHLRVR